MRTAARIFLGGIQGNRVSTPATKQERNFDNAIKTLSENVQQARQYFVVHHAFFEALKYDQALEDRLNEYPLFWNLNLSSWQAGLFTSLGRIYDNDGYGMKRILLDAQKNRTIFSLNSLERRKQRAGMTGDRLQNYMAGKTDLSGEYLDRLSQQVDSYRDMYRRACIHVRDKVYAHSALLTNADRAEVFSELSESEVFTLIAFAIKIDKALAQLFDNGREMTLPFELPEPPSIVNPPASNNSWQVPDLDNWGLADKVVELLVGIRDMHKPVRALANLVDSNN